MKTFLAMIYLSFSFCFYAEAKLELSREVKRGPITKDACGNFEDGVKALQRLQDTSSFDSDGQIALYNFSARAMAALYHQRMINEKNPKLKAHFKRQFELACANAS